jgi:hypothetical protein
MSRVDELIKEALSSEFDLGSLVSLVEEVIRDTSPLSVDRASLQEGSDKARKTVDEILGSLRINAKRWGSLAGSDERSVIQNYVAALGVATPDDILVSLASVTESARSADDAAGDTPNCSVSKVLAKVQLLNTLSTILNSFDPRVGGFLNENFLAALFGGEDIKVDGNLGVADFKVDGQNYSLKTKASGSAITGSLIKLLLDMGFDASSPELSLQRPMTYLIFNKHGSDESGTTSVSVEKLTITPDNFMNVMKHAVFTGSALGRTKKSKNVKTAMKSALGLLGGEDPKKVGISFSLPRSGKVNTLIQPVAKLNTDTSALYDAAAAALGDMVEEFKNLQEMFNSLVLDMNEYFASMTNSSADSFRMSAGSFESAVSTTVRGDDSCSPE